VVISLDTARRQAREGGWPLATELRRLLAHGILHCRGYDHERAADARRMAAAERRLLGAKGMVGDSLSQRG
jgi:probable rRNA maturation factor